MAVRLLHEAPLMPQDGVAFVHQCPIMPGKEFTYRFPITDSPGTCELEAQGGATCLGTLSAGLSTAVDHG